MNGLGDLHTTQDGGCVASMASSGNIKNKFCKLAADGAVEWAKSIDFPTSNQDVRLQPIGNKVIAFTHSTALKKFMAVAFRADGSEAWNKVYSINPDIFVFNTAPASDSSGMWLVGNFGFPRGVAVMKLDTSGNIVLTKRYAVNGNNDPLELRNLDATPDGGFIAAGRVTLPNSNNDFLILKFDASGNIEWSKKIGTYTGGVLEVGGQVFARPNGGYLVNYIAYGQFSANVAFSQAGDVEFAEQITFQSNATPFFGQFTERNGQMQAWVQHVAEKMSSIDLDPTGHFLSCAGSSPLDIVATDYPLSEQPVTISLLAEISTVTDATIVELPITDPVTKAPVCMVEVPCPEDCANSIDDDEDGYVDCFDSDCQCFDGVDCKPTFTASIPVRAKLAWQSPVNLADINSIPIVANLDPQNGSIPEIIVLEGISNNINQFTVSKLLIYQGDGSNADDPDELTIPQLMSNHNNAQCIGDVNSDGTPEMAVVCFDKRIRVYSAFTQGSSTPMTLFATSNSQVYSSKGHLGMADFDSDGTPEIYAGYHIFQFDFTNPNLPLLNLKLIGGQHSGYNGVTTSAPVAVDILSVTDCNGDPDCEGLELVAGAYIYSVDLDPLDGDGVQIKIARSLNAMLSTTNFRYGFTYVADINLDGVLDIVTTGRHGNAANVGFYIWNKNALMGAVKIPDPSLILDKQFFTIAIANVFDDKTAGFQQDFPEIIFPSNTKISSFNYHKWQTTPNTPYWWSVNTQDESGLSGPSCFDFNGDGFSEIVYRDEQYFRLMYGGALPLPPGVDADRNWTKIACNSQTHDEYPVVANVDADGEAEIVATGYLPPYYYGQPDFRGRLWVFESDSLPWQSARPIWNQFNYNGVNINDDLTIPKHQQAHHLEFPGIGSGKRPFNTAQTQWSTWDSDFDPLNPVPDAALTVDSTACEGDSLRLWLSLCNHGSSLLPDSQPIAFYQNDPRQAGAVLKGISLAQTAVPVDACASFSVKIAAVFNAPIFVVANDDGSHPLPYAITDFPITAQPECDFENNFDDFVFNHQSPSLDLGPDLSLCSSSVTTLNAGAGFSSYRWQDGTTDASFTAFGPGTYWVDVKDGCGNLQSDTVHIFLNQTATVELGNDLPVCEGESIQLDAPGFTNVQWWPANGLSCTDCPSPTAAPNADITYYVTAANGNCLASDSIHIFLYQKPVLTLIAQDGDCLNAPQISVSAMGTAPLGFVWSNGGTGPTISPSISGSYTVTVTSGLGCEATATASVMVANSLAVGLQTIPLSCSNGSGTATATASGGTVPFTYIWSNGGTASTVSVTSPGPIGVTVTDANGCISSTSATVGVVGQLQLGISTNPISCNDGQDGAATVQPINGTAPFNYNWSNGGDAPTVSVTSPGPIGVTVTDANGCISSTSTTVGVVGQLQLGISITPISCHDGQDGAATVQPINGTAPFSWLWANGATSSQLTGIASGNYSVTVTDAIGCTDDLSFTIAAPTALALSISADGVSCFGEMDGAATVDASGGTPGYQYFWSNFQTTATVSQLGQGLQTVTVTDENGCTSTASAFLSEPPLLTAAVQADDPVVCPDSTTNIAAILLGGTPPYAFSWPGGQTDSLLTNVGAGDYIVTVTDENGCTANASVAIQSQQLAMLAQDSVVAASSPTAADGSVFVEFSGGQPPFTYLWSNGDTSQNLLSVPAGDYILTLSDALGCEQSFPFTVDFLNAASQKLGKAWAASILPNPAAEGGLAQLAIQSDWPQIIDYQLFEVTGELLLEERIQLSAGHKLYPVTMPSAAGVYLVVLSNEEDIVCLKWVVMD